MTATTETGVENTDKDVNGEPLPADPNTTSPTEPAEPQATTGVEPHDNGQPHVQTKEAPTA